VTTRRDMLLSSASAVAAAALTPASRLTAEPVEAQQPAGARLASLSDYEKAAKAKMTPMAWEYIAGGAGDEITLAWNHDAFGDLRLRNRVLVDVSRIDTGTKLFGQDLAHPILLSPTAYHKLVHREGETATARGAGAAKATMIVSSFATRTIEDIARAAAGPLWFQLYVQPDREFTRALVERAQAAGVRALVLTVDTPVLGARNRETRIGFKLPAGVTRENLTGLDQKVASATHRPAEGQIYSAVLEPRLTWKDVDWLRSFAKVPVSAQGNSRRRRREARRRVGRERHHRLEPRRAKPRYRSRDDHRPAACRRGGRRPAADPPRRRHPQRHRRPQGHRARRQRRGHRTAVPVRPFRRRIRRRGTRRRHTQDRAGDGDGADRQNDNPGYRSRRAVVVTFRV
jgi:hypothetical protein